MIITLPKKKKLNEIESAIQNKMVLNQGIFSITNMYKDKKIDEKLRDPVVGRDEKGKIQYMSIDFQHRLKQNFILYKEYNKDLKKHSCLDIVIKTKRIENMNEEQTIKYLSKIYKNAKRYNRKVFIYKLEDKNRWDNLWLKIITVFHNYPISRYL
jgi:hypothetical protein